jgi:SlyX protein
MNDPPPLAERVVDLELLVTHLQRDIETLNQVVLDQRKELDALQRLIARLDDRVAQMGEGDEPRDLVAEKPPHY